MDFIFVDTQEGLVEIELVVKHCGGERFEVFVVVCEGLVHVEVFRDLGELVD